MNTGQIMIILGVLTLFTLYQLNYNNSALRNEINIIEGDSVITALALAQGYLEMAQNLLYDEVLNNGAPKSESYFTSPLSLGAETGESYPLFDDIDDFNNFVRTEQTNIGEFTIHCQVFYIEQSQPDTPVYYQTYFKKFRVWVTSPQLVNPVELQFIFCYF